MTIEPAVALPEAESPVLDVEHVATLAKAALPDWHWRASAEFKDKLTLAWITNHRLGAQLAQHTALIKSPADFARPLLKAAMKGGMDGDFDVDKNTFVHSTSLLSGIGSDAIKEPLEVILPPALIPKVGITRWSLLEAALQNFSAAEIDEFEDENVFILQSDDSIVRSYLNPRRFAHLCRKLNIGARYQTYLKSRFWPYDQIDPSAPDLSVYGLYQFIMAEEKSRMEVLSHEAHLRGDISGSVYRLLLQWVHSVPQPKWWIWDVRVHRLSLLQVPLAQGVYGPCPLHGVLVITPRFDTEQADVPCVVYAPHDTQRPLFEYPSLKTFNDIYAFKLRSPAPRAQLQQAVELRHQPYFFKQLTAELVLKGRTPAGMPIEVLRPHPDLNVTLTPVTETPFVELYRQIVSLSLSNARSLAVPTDEETAKTLLERFQALFEAGVPLLNLAAFFVPPLGAVLLVSTGIDMLSEVYTGFEDWSHGDVVEAFEHFGAVAKNLTVMSVAGKATAHWSAVRSEIDTLSFMDDLHWVKTSDGQRRYWKFDLAPYASSVALDPQMRPDAQGIYNHNGQSFVHIKGQPYAVKFDSQRQQWRVVHATRAGAYAPVIEYNGHGAWQLSVEHATDWDAEEVFKRAWSGQQALTNEHVQQIMNIVGYHEDALRWSHANGTPPPALVIDTFKRFKIADEVDQLLTRVQPPEQLPQGSLQGQKAELFSQRYQAEEDFSQAPMALIHQHYKSLPASVVKEVLQHAHPGEVDSLIKNRRVPLRMAEEIRHYSQQVRMARAIEGCYLGIDPGGVTYPLGNGLFSQLVLGQKYLREAPQHLLPAPPAGDFLTISQTTYLLTKMKADPVLRDELVNYALNHPDQARKAIGLQPIKQWFKPPMRLAGGRLGYPLSGRGRGGDPRTNFLTRRVGQLYPTYTERQRIAFLNALRQRKIWPEGELMRRELELDGLSEMLREWTLKPLPDYSIAARRDVEPQTIKRSAAHTIKRAWRRETRVEGRAFGLGAAFDRAVLTGHDLPDARGYKLDLSGFPVGDLPGLSGNFGHVSVLIMDGMALNEPPEEFLSSFPNVRWLSMQNNRLTRLPRALQKMKHLEKLDLGHNQIELTSTSVPALAAMTGLKELNLSHNPLGLVPDVGRMEYLQLLDVRNTGSITWPVGAYGLTNLTYLDLRDNQIKEIPDAAFSAPKSVNEATYLHDNPLSPLSESRLNDYAERTGVSMGYSSGRRYSHLEDPSDYAWFLTGAGPEVSTRVDVWRALEQDPATKDLRRVLRGLRSTPAYANENTRVDLIERVGRVLDALGEDTVLRESLLVSSEHGSTCGDGVALIFSNLEILTLAAKTSATGADAPRELLRLARNVYRLDQVELLARQFINERLARIPEQDSQESDELDDIEFRLAFRVALAGPLELPAQPQSMVYEELADLPAHVIESTRLRVLANERRGSHLFDSICERDFWVRFLIEKYAEQFDAVYQEHAERSNTVEFETDDLTDHGYKQSLESISADYKTQQKILIAQLTRKEMRANPF